MSNVLSIAALSCTLRNLLLAQMPLLDADLADLEVTLQAPDVARKGVTKAQLNLFLYQVTNNIAWRNQNNPRQVRPGEDAAPALALNLHYLMTAYGRGDSDNDGLSHRVLAAGMSTLHDHPVLNADDIRGALPGNDLADQLERVRITPLALGVEELSKLWTACQASYRVSAAYEATVLLIDSQRTARAPLPVLSRGSDDRGVIANASAAAVLESLQLPPAQTALRLGEAVILRGRHVSAEHAQVRFSNPHWDVPLDLVPTLGEQPGSLRVDIADDDASLTVWVPGLYTVALYVQPPGQPALLSNELVLPLAPRIVLDTTTVVAGAELSLSCAPRIRDRQRVLLLLGDRVLTPHSISHVDDSSPTVLDFQIPTDVAAGLYTVRLRVDGIGDLGA
ncbi:MAG: DUF4255 domain-containing protein, partial [Rhodanobacter sp.]